MTPIALLKPPAPPLARVAPTGPDVSVCIVNWNCREMLRDRLELLLRHEQGVAAEVIVVDNASDDGAADMVSMEFPEVVLIRNAQNAGFARANNQAARRARGRDLFFLNNDTLVPPETLAQLVEEAERNPAAGILAPRLRDGRGRIQCSCRAFPTVAALLHRTCLFRWTGLFRRAYRRFRWRDTDLEKSRPVDVVMGAALLIRRERFWRWGGWDEGYTFGGEDVDLCARVGRQQPVVFYPEAEVIHHGRASSRQLIEYAHSQTLIGITRFLSRNGSSRGSMLVYKLAVTLDAPLQWLGHLVQYAWRRLRGRRKAATRSWLVVRALGHFMRRDIGSFWRV